MSSELHDAIEKIKAINKRRQKFIQDQVNKVELSDSMKNFIAATVKLEDSIENTGNKRMLRNGISEKQVESIQRTLKGEYTGSLTF